MSQYNAEAKMPPPLTKEHHVAMLRANGLGLLRDAAVLEGDEAEAKKLEAMLVPLFAEVDRYQVQVVRSVEVQTVESIFGPNRL